MSDTAELPKGADLARFPKGAAHWLGFAAATANRLADVTISISVMRDRFIVDAVDKRGPVQAGWPYTVRADVLFEDCVNSDSNRLVDVLVTLDENLKVARHEASGVA